MSPVLTLLNPSRSRARYVPIGLGRVAKVRWYGGRRRAKSGVRGKRRNPGGRAALLLKPKGKKSKATKSRRTTVAKSAKRAAAARKGARTKARNKAKRSAAAKRSYRKSKRSGGKRRSRKTRSGARSRNRLRRARRHKRIRQGRHRPVVYKVGKRYYAGRRRPKGGRRRRSAFRGIRLNPPLGIPSFSQVKGTLIEGGYALAGWVGVNGVVMGADMLGLAKLKEGRDPKIVALINAVVRILAIPLVAWGAGKVFGARAKSLAAIGGSFNLVYHGVQDIAAQTSVLPAWGAPLLLGYDGVGDYQAYGLRGIGDWSTSSPPVLGSGGSPYGGAFADQQRGSAEMLA